MVLREPCSAPLSGGPQNGTFGEHRWAEHQERFRKDSAQIPEPPGLVLSTPIRPVFGITASLPFGMRE